VAGSFRYASCGQGVTAMPTTKLGSMLIDFAGARADVAKLIAASRDPGAFVATHGPLLVRQGEGWLVQGLARALAGEAPREGWRDPKSSGTWVPSLEAVGDAVVHCAAQALARVDRLDDEGLLLSALRAESRVTREAVAGALGRIVDVRAVDPLLAALEDPVAAMRLLAARALAGRYTDARVDAALLAALQRRDLAVVAGGCAVTVAVGEGSFAATIIDALERFDDRRLAEEMRKSTNELLRRQGETWIRNHRDQPSHLASPMPRW
jgi:hypothetical protein